MGVHSEECKVGLTRQIADFPIALGEISILRKDR